MDPTLIAAGAKIIGAALTPAPAAPSYSTGSATFSNGMGNDSWTVTTSGSKATTSTTKTDTSDRSAASAAEPAQTAPGPGLGTVLAMGLGLLFLRS